MYLNWRPVLAALGLMLLSSTASSMCIAPVSVGDKDGSYVLKNTCSYVVNVKYTFSDSRPMSGTYSTLPPGHSTFDQARQSESAQFYECVFPAVPQTIRGKCVGGGAGNFGERGPISDDQAKERIEQETIQNALAEQQRQDAEIEQMVIEAERSGSMNVPTIPSSPRSDAVSINVFMQQLQSQKQPSSRTDSSGLNQPISYCPLNGSTSTPCVICPMNERLGSGKCRRLH